MDSDSSAYSKTKLLSSRAKIFIFILEISMIIALLVIWLSSGSVQKSKSLTVLFFYCFPSEFLIGLLPHEPILIYYGKFYSPLTVAIVSVFGTVLAEAINYSVFKFVKDIDLFKKLIDKKVVGKIVALFNRAPFAAVLIAGFTPVPFYPFRFLVVMSHYPVQKYLLAVFLSRAPRFFILAQIGYTFNISGAFLIALFIVLVITVNIPLIGNLLKKDREF